MEADAVLALIPVVTVALCEEVVFRGYLYHRPRYDASDVAEIWAWLKEHRSTEQ